jgi:hypothetical protein
VPVCSLEYDYHSDYDHDDEEDGKGNHQSISDPVVEAVFRRAPGSSGVGLALVSVNH